MNRLAESFAKIKEPFPQSDSRGTYSPVVTTEPGASVIANAEMEATHSSKSSDPESNPDFKTIKIVSTLILLLLQKCWMLCTTGLFVTFVAYWCYGSVLALFLFICGLCGLFYQVSDWLLYHPDEPSHSRLYVPMPTLLGMPSDSLFITAEDGIRIHAVFIKQDHPIISQVPTILFFHGNAGNIGHRLTFAQGFYKLIRCNMLLLEYRGYGHSEGTPSEEGLYLDAQAGLKYLLQLPYIDKNKIVVFGRSLGGAVAIDLASRPEFGKHIFVLIVENTFTSIPDIAIETFRFGILKWLPIWIYKNKFNSARKIAKVTSPTLFLSGQADNLIPPDMMKQLSVLCESSIKRRQLFAHGTHNDTWTCKGYYRSVNIFLDDVMLFRHDPQRWSQEARNPGAGEIY